MRILVADDDPDVREAIATFLTLRGHEVTEVADGAEALQEMRRRKPAVLVLDLMMPVLDGWSVRAAMASEGGLADIPTIVVSGAADLSAVNGCVVLRKPVEPDTLLAAVARCAAS